MGWPIQIVVSGVEAFMFEGRLLVIDNGNHFRKFARYPSVIASLKMVSSDGGR